VLSANNIIVLIVAVCLMSVPVPALMVDGPAESQDDSSLPVLHLLHEEYPPYVYRKDGKVVGKVARIATIIARRAGYTIEWRQTAYRRLVREIILSAKPLCAAGYRQEHRDLFGIMASKPFGWFPGSALAIRKSDVHLFNKHRSIEDIMSDTSLRGAFLMGARYIGVGEDVWAGRVKRHILIGSTDAELGVLVARNRAHFAVINPDQTGYLIENVKSASNLTVYKPSGMAPPRDVGFICSKSTNGEIWERINEAIGSLPAFNDWNWDTEKATLN